MLDNCDGEVARAKNQASEFGENFDTFVDWVVHAGFFSALGIQVMEATGNLYWLWLGLISSIGCSINYFIGIILDLKIKENIDRSTVAHDGGNIDQKIKINDPKQYLIFIFRELFRADFCFLVLALTIFDITWLLLPATAVGAQIYWIMRFLKK